MSELMKYVRRFKLGACLYRSKTTANNALEVDVCKQHMAKEIGEKILRGKISVKDNGDTYDVESELLVIKLDEFKMVVEAAIQDMPMDAIRKIRDGETLP